MKKELKNKMQRIKDLVDDVCHMKIDVEERFEAYEKAAKEGDSGNLLSEYNQAKQVYYETKIQLIDEVSKL